MRAIRGRHYIPAQYVAAYALIPGGWSAIRKEFMGTVETSNGRLVGSYGHSRITDNPEVIQVPSVLVPKNADVTSSDSRVTKNRQ